MAISNEVNPANIKPRRSPADALLRLLFLNFDVFYRHWQRLDRVDELLAVKRARYPAEDRFLGDGSRVRKGEPVLELHFNNRFLSRLHSQYGEQSRRRIAVAFGRQLMLSLQRLKQFLETRDEYQTVRVVTGITWFNAHGDRLGFESELLPDGWQQRVLRCHFQLLLRALFPQLAATENARLQPRRFWLTRESLDKTSSGSSYYVAS